MFGGGGGLNPRKMKQMMEQMGIELEELDAEEVVISLAGGDRLVFDAPDVTRMDARGQQTYQVVGEPERSGGAEAGELEAADGDEAVEGATDEDIELVMARAGVDEETAREALESADGDLAAAISRLE